MPRYLYYVDLLDKKAASESGESHWYRGKYNVQTAIEADSEEEMRHIVKKTDRYVLVSIIERDSNA